VRANRVKAASVLGVPEYVNATASSIEGRLSGNYQLGGGLGAKTFKDDYMVFFRDGEVNAPRSSHAIWFLAQYQRLGLLETPPDYKALTEAILLRDVYEKVAKAEKIAVPDDDMAPFTVKLDKTTFNPAKPQLEVNRA
jgi:nitrate/nitrite transport system substrate-binding protein